MKTKEEIAEQFKVSTKTVERWCESMGMPYVQIGNVIRFEEYEVNEWMFRFRANKRKLIFNKESEK